MPSAGGLNGRAPAALRVVVAVALLTGVVFALTKTWSLAADAYRLAIGVLQWPVHGALVEVRHTMDPTDLIALPACLAAAWIERRRLRAQRERSIPRA